MIKGFKFLEALRECGINFFAGVPDSLLKEICGYISDTLPSENHVITANEGGAIGMAIGHHLATGEVPLVYMQNSGLGNAVNPLLSLADKEVYSIPMVLMVGWRGEPQKKDEPQHIKQGRIQNDLLRTMEIPFRIIDGESADFRIILRDLVSIAKKESRPVAIAVRKGTFEKYNPRNVGENNNLMLREAVLEEIIENLNPNDVIVSTTGKSSREIFEIRQRKKQGHQNDFLIVGGMGHASQISLGVANSSPGRQVYCIDGDGAAIMHMGAMAINAASNLPNFKHILINNGAHDSVGGQPTVGFEIDFCKIAIACGYREARSVSAANEMQDAISFIKSQNGPVFLEIIVRKGARSDLGRPTTTPQENKAVFIDNLQTSNS